MSKKEYRQLIGVLGILLVLALIAGVAQKYSVFATLSHTAHTDAGWIQTAGLGLIAPACGSSCVANAGQSCSASCNGQTSFGTIQCDGSCSVASCPAVPQSSSCTANAGQSCVSGLNACGQTSFGSIQCNGSCDAQVPNNSLCGAPIITTQTPLVVNPGTSAALTWSAAPATNCSIKGTDGFQYAGGAKGTVSSPAITSATTYTVTCWIQNQYGTGPSAQGTIRVILNPSYQEI